MGEPSWLRAAIACPRLLRVNSTSLGNVRSTSALSLRAAVTRAMANGRDVLLLHRAYGCPAAYKASLFLAAGEWEQHGDTGRRPGEVPDSYAHLYVLHEARAEAFRTAVAHVSSLVPVRGRGSFSPGPRDRPFRCRCRNPPDMSFRGLVGQRSVYATP